MSLSEREEDIMKKRDRELVRNVEVKVRELPAGAMKKVEELVNSATPAKREMKEPEHVER